MRILSARSTGKYKGEWQPMTFYEKDDLVYIGDVIYVAVANFTSNSTFDSLNWDCPVRSGPTTVVITSDKSNFTDATPFEIQITFSNAVTGFVIGDIITDSNTATFSNFSGSGTSYTVDVTPSLNGNIPIQIGANVTNEGNSSSDLLIVMSNVTRLLNDYPGAYSAISMVLLSSAYVGDCMRVRRVDNNAESDIGFSSGMVDIAAINTFRSGQDVVIVTMYDQSGNNNDWSQSDPAKQPPISDSGTLNMVNGIPATMSPDKSIYDLTLTDNGVSSTSMFLVTKNSGRLATMVGGQSDTIYAGLMQNSGSTAYSPFKPASSWVNGVQLVNQSRVDLLNATNGVHAVVSMIDLDMSSYTSFHTNYTSNTSFDSADNMQAIIMYNSDKSADRIGIETIITDQFIN